MGESQQADKARALRRAGLSRSQIADALGLKSGGGALSRWLKDVPPPEWTLRPNAKDDIRDKAVAMRRTGMSYREIQVVVGVSKSTLSLWLRDVELTDDQRAELERRQAIGRAKAAATNRGRRIATETTTIADARAQIQAVAESELFVAGVVAYWAEGSKAKPWRADYGVCFMNSDPDLIRLFLRWLTLLGYGADRLTFRIHIHENADRVAAREHWARVIGVPPSEFAITLKRHNPKTVRKNVGPAYHGCLVVRVTRSTELGRQIAGWWQGIITACELNSDP